MKKAIFSHHNVKLKMPYFDLLLREFGHHNERVLQTFGRHVHWGFWENPQKANGSIDDFSKAADCLADKVIEAAHIKSGQALLDAGCGFGGTLDQINQQYHDMNLTGLNIDARQLQRARKLVKARERNKLQFVEGNACKMPFEDASFDRVTAVECIFHFPSRLDFFKEASRVLRPKGNLALSDFVLKKKINPVLYNLGAPLRWIVNLTYGNSEANIDMKEYAQIAKQTGFKLTITNDITRNTLPTYPVLLALYRASKSRPFGSKMVTRIMQVASHMGIVRYMVLGFEKI